MRIRKLKCLLVLPVILTSVTLTNYYFKLCYQMKKVDVNKTNMMSAPAYNYQYNFKDDLLKPGPGFNTSEILLYSAVAGNMTKMSIWDEVSVFGWEAKHLIEQVYMCCLLYRSGNIVISQAHRKVFRTNYSCPMIARHYACETKESDRGERAMAITLKTREKYGVCDAPLASYVGIDYPYKHPEEIAIFAKIVFGNLSARDLITWFEVHRLFGFSKALVYPYQLNGNATRVLQYYERLGVLEILPYSIPGPEHGQKYTPMGTETTKGWNNKHVSLMDGFERLKGYKYIVNLDVDEYLIPKKNESWMDLFDRLFREKKDAAGFHIMSYIHIKSWAPTNKSSPFSIGRYLSRTKLTSDRRKHVSMPSRIAEGGFTTHKVYPLSSFRTYKVSENDAALHHYRSCRLSWLRKHAKFPCFNVARFHDDTVNSLLKKVEDDVLDLVSKLHV